MPRPRASNRAYVDSCPIFITSALVRLALADSASSSTLHQFPRLPGAQLRYSLRCGPDSLPAALLIPRQPVTLAPAPRWIPAQTIPLCFDYIQRPTRGTPSRRWWFSCPARKCGRRCLHLYLPDRAQRFRCARCCHLCYESSQVARLADALHARGLPPGRASLDNLAAIADVLATPGVPPLPLSVWPALWRWSQIGEGGGKWAHVRSRRTIPEITPH